VAWPLETGHRPVPESEGIREVVDILLESGRLLEGMPEQTELEPAGGRGPLLG
jgi:hypothetical protein